MAKIIIINDENKYQLSVADRGFNYGDGFFSTMKVNNGTIDLWPFHLARLVKTQNALGFPSIDFDEIKQSLDDVAKMHQTAVIKIVVTRGVGGRGYGLPEHAIPQVFISVSSFPEHYHALQQQGVALDTLDFKLGLQPALAGMKTLNRLEQVLIKQEMASKNVEEGLVCDLNGDVIETSIANIIAVKNNQLYTPDTSQSGIRGVFLDYLSSKMTINIEQITTAQLKLMDSVFCCNSLMGLVPVKRIDDVTFDKALTIKTYNTMLSKYQEQ